MSDVDEAVRVRFFAIPDGYQPTSTKAIDVTDDIAALYDLVVGSMDFGSGFLTVEDAIPLVKIAGLGGYEDPDVKQREETVAKYERWAADPNMAVGPSSAWNERAAVERARPTLMEQAREQIAAAGGHE